MLLIWATTFLEFFHISILNGYIRIYHLISIFLILINLRQALQILNSEPGRRLSIVILISIFSSIINGVEAFKSMLLLLLNFSITISVFILLLTNKITISKLIKFYISATFIIVSFQIIQFIFFINGMNIGFSINQISQINSGFAPGFRTEANTQAKFLFFIFFISILSLKYFTSKLFGILFYILIVIGFILSLTRTIIYIIPFTLIIFYLINLIRNNELAIKVDKRLLYSILFLFIPFFFIEFINIYNDYASYKITNFFNPSYLYNNDNSFLLRFLGYKKVFFSIFESIKSFFIGVGWGQIYILEDVFFEFQAGSADVFTITAYSGVFALIFYLSFLINVWRSLRRISNKTNTIYAKEIISSFNFVSVAFFILSFFNGLLITPELWIIYGCVIFIIHKFKHTNQNIESLYF